MATVRAYKLAAELGVDKDELIKKAGELGIQLRSAMVGLEADQVELLRKQFGSAVPSSVETVEKRVGSTIRRRRKKAEEPPAPEPTPEVAAAPESVAEESPVEVAAEPETVAEEPAPLAEAEPQPQPVAAEPAPAPAAGTRYAGLSEPARIVEDPLLAQQQQQKQQQPAGATQSSPGQAAAQTAGAAAGAAPGTRRDDAAANSRAPSGLVRRKVIESHNLKEQETVARMARGNVQAHLEKRRMIVEQQSRMQPRRRKGKTGKAAPVMPGKPRKVVRLGSSISFVDLSAQTGLKVRDLLRKVRALDAEVERDAWLDPETATLLAEEAGFEVHRIETGVEKAVAAAAATSEAAESDLESRPPVVTVMGHVDHGKTSVLDAIRKTNVVEGEAGGITQHIGAYQARTGDESVATFIDTPGHAAFTQMRARGAEITDIVVLVVAADDGVMPQTVEAIAHAKAAGVPIIVAINKIDKPEANPSRVKQALLEHELVAEEFGGDTICIEVSATRGDGLDKLLEMLGLQAELLELQARRTGHAQATVVEAELDRGRGPVATVLVQQGTLKRGDAVVAGLVSGRIRSLTDYLGAPVKEAGPAMPVQIVGLAGVPEAGDDLVVVKNEREAKQIAEHRMAQEKRAAAAGPSGPGELDADDIFAALSGSDEKELFVVLKADVRGTMEAIRDSLEKLSTERVKLNVLHAGVGGINESDVTLASASKAVVMGFHVRPEPAARKAAERSGVEIRTFDIVYDAIDEAQALMLGLLPPKRTEKLLGTAEVRQLFVIPNVGTVAGCFVPEGIIRRNGRVRVVRDSVPVYTGRLSALKRFKDDVREVNNGLECAMCVENYNDVKVGDVIECFEIEETPDTL